MHESLSVNEQNDYLQILKKHQTDSVAAEPVCKRLDEVDRREKNPSILLDFGRISIAFHTHNLADSYVDTTCFNRSGH